jgi:glycosyltransferase involved in cell wall biosynthesis
VDVRVLILDDASPDNTPQVAAELVAQDPRVEYRRHAVNQGHIATYNEGLAWADGDYIVLLSADDMLTLGSLLRATRLMDTHPEVGFVFGQALTFTTDQPLPPARTSSTEGRWRIWDGQEWLESACRSGHIYIRSPEVVVRAGLQRQLGGYRPELPHTGDIEMWMRFAVHGAVGHIRDADQAFYRIHGRNMHHQLFSAHLTELRQRKDAYDAVFREWGHRIVERARLQRLVYRRLAREALGFAGGAFDRGETAPIAELVDFARCTYRRAALTPEYVGLRLRMLLGRRVWPLPPSTWKL